MPDLWANGSAGPDRESVLPIFGTVEIHAPPVSKWLSVAAKYLS
jgi:hypothetical protein